MRYNTAGPSRAVVDVGMARHFDSPGIRDSRLAGYRKMTAWLARSGFPDVSKHSVDRLMRDENMNGLVRGRKTLTTIPAKNGLRASDMLNRHFTAPRPNHTWVTDFTYAATWAGCVYVAFAIDLFSRAIVGWQASTVKGTSFRTGPLKGLPEFEAFSLQPGSPVPHPAQRISGGTQSNCYGCAAHAPGTETLPMHRGG